MALFLQHIWNKPYPISNFSQSLSRAVVFGLFVAFFLYLFTPFGLNDMPSNLLIWLSACFGAVAFLVILLLAVLPFVFPTVFEESRWTVGKEFLFSMAHFLCIAVANLLVYPIIGEDEGISWGMFGYALFVTFSVGMMPSIFFILYDQNRLLQKNTSKGKELDVALKHGGLHEDVLNKVGIKGENGEVELVVTPTSWRCAIAGGNYVEVYYEEDSMIRKKLIRARLRMVEDSLSGFNGLFRCHRGYLINLPFVTHVEGNARGYNVMLQGMDEPIPVSRSFIEDFERRIQGK